MSDEIEDAVKEAGYDVASAIREAAGRDMGRDIGFVGEIAMALQSIASALHRIATAMEEPK